MAMTSNITRYYPGISIDITHITILDIRTYHITDRKLDRKIKFAHVPLVNPEGYR